MGKHTKRNFAAPVIVDDSALPEDTEYTTVTADVIKQMFPDVAEELINEGKQMQQEETTETAEVAATANMDNETEANLVREAMAGKMDSATLAKKLLAAKKEFKPEADKKQVMANRSAENPEAGHTSVSTTEQPKKNGMAAALDNLRNKGGRR